PKQYLGFRPRRAGPLDEFWSGQEGQNDAGRIDLPAADKAKRSPPGGTASLSATNSRKPTLLALRHICLPVGVGLRPLPLAVVRAGLGVPVAVVRYTTLIRDRARNREGKGERRTSHQHRDLPHHPCLHIAPPSLTCGRSLDVSLSAGHGTRGTGWTPAVDWSQTTCNLHSAPDSFR